MELNKPETQLKIFLFLIALHSFFVGIGLILLPPEYLEYFGFFNYTYSFFQVQGGVFHIVMCVAYLMAMKYIPKSPGLVYFAIIAKLIATIFLLIYFLFIENSWMILISGCGDFIMAIFLYFLLKRYQINNSI